MAGREAAKGATPAVTGRNVLHVPLDYLENTTWRNRSEFLAGRQATFTSVTER